MRRRLAVALLAVGCVGLLVAAAVLTFASRQPGQVFAGSVESPDANLDELPDSLSNALGVDPYEPTPAQALPAGWIERHGLPIHDPQLAARTAPYPKPPESPAVFGPQGLPADFRMTYAEVYAYGRPATWNETTDGPFDSRLDPTRWYVENTSDVPYAWLVHYGLDPFDASVLDRVPPGASVNWTPREAYARGLDPTSEDGDGDWLPDETELQIGTNPRANSSTGSGVLDGWLVMHQLDPLNQALPYQDPLHRGMTILETFQHSLRLYPSQTRAGGGLDPRKVSTLDGPLPDAWIVRYGFDALRPGIEERVLQSEIASNETGNHTVEFRLIDAYNVNKPQSWNESRNGPWWGGTDPTKNDTDGDGLTDLREVLGWRIQTADGAKEYRSDPTRIDSDGDGLSDREEHDGLVGGVAFPPTSPANPDTDGDGLTDGEELGIVLYHEHKLPKGLDPTNRDSARQGMTDGFAADYWLKRHDECDRRVTYRWGAEPRPTTGEALFGDADASACERLLPEADLKGSGEPNLLNSDVDADGLLNGWEVRPEGYISSSFAPKPGNPPRPETDPANVDTDGDQLPDGWEVKHGVPFSDGHGWNLDPGKWSSFDDGVGDADKDLDNDGTTWYSYRVGGGITATAHVFKSTNLDEYEAGSNPNLRDSSGDGIPDGWKIFWGQKYFGLSLQDLGDVYPGAPGPLAPPKARTVPQVGRDDNQVLSTSVLTRVLLVDDTNSSVEGCLDHKTTITTLQNARITVCTVTASIPHDYRAVAENMTNPYLDDSSREGIPDAWKSLWAWMGRQLPTRVSAVLPGASLDIDSDGLTLLEEYQYATNPYLADSDLGGASDGQEQRLGLDPMDPTDDAQGASQNLDSDGDGVINVDEIGGFPNARNEIVKTDPTDPDTDHDGLLDGRSLHNVLGRKLHLSNATDAAILAGFEARGLLVVILKDGSADVLGEQDQGTDPTLLSTSGGSVPDGWDAAYGASITDPSEKSQRYAYGKPEWWDEARDGVWRGGLLPGEKATDDHDGDGLNDLNGEDPVPFANPRNVLGRGDPLAPDINATERLLRSQAYGGGFHDVARPLVLPAPLKRAETILTLDPLPSALAGNGTVNFTGKLVTRAGAPVKNATVVLSMGSRPMVLGAAITNDTGAFNGTVEFSLAIPPPADASGVPVFGNMTGAKDHRNPTSALPPLRATGNQTVFAWAYNGSWYAPPRQAQTYALPNGTKSPGFLGNASAAQSVTLLVPSLLSLDVPSSAKVATTIQVNASLADAWGRPVPREKLEIEGTGLNATTGDEGIATFDLALPHAPGVVALNLTFNGSGTLLPGRLEQPLTLSLPTKITALPPPAPVGPGATFAIQGVLLSSAGQPVDNATLHAQIGDVSVQATTNLAGEFRIVGTLPPEASGADYRVTVAYGGNVTMDGSSATVTVKVLSSPRWIVSPVTANVGDAPSVSATLVDAAGSPLGGIPFDFTTSWGARVSGTTSSTGRASVPLNLAGIPPGEALFTFSQTQASTGPSRASQTILVTSDTTLAIDEVSLVRGGASFVRGTLAGAEGRPVGGHVVSVQVRDAPAQVVTKPDGSFNATFTLGSDDALGPAAVHASFPGSQDNVYRGSRASAAGRVQDAAHVALARSDVVATSPILRGTLTNLLGQPLGDAELDLGYLGLQSGAATDGTGGFSTSLALPPGAALGPHPLVVTVKGRPDLRPSIETIPLTLKGAGTLDAQIPFGVIAGTDLRFPAVARDAAGAPIDDIILTASIDGKAVPVDHAGGIAVVRVPRDMPLGAHKLTLGGTSPLYQVADRSVGIRVQTPTQIASLGQPSVVAGEIGFLPILVSGPGGPVANATLSVTIPGRAPMQLQTDASGVTQIPIPPLLSRTTAKVAFAGDGIHGATVASVTIHAGPAPPPSYVWLVLAVGALLLVAGIVALWLGRRYRSRKGVAGLMARAARSLRAGKVDVRILYTIYLEIVQLSGTTEEEAEVLTFGEILGRFVKEPSVQPEAAVLNSTFNRALYGGGLMEDEMPAVARALDRIAEVLRRPAPAPEGASDA